VYKCSSFEAGYIDFLIHTQIRPPSGTTVTGIVPTNTYPCADGKHVIIGGNGDSIYKRLMKAAGREDLVS
jgi:crotonobetainyl-CoA:carnitine CoA-transferase CaiB-like acyl-CoA transferase